jgi:hypothetical protein
VDPAFTSFVLGYHGCDRKLAERVLAGKAVLKPSRNDYDWLGDGIYFWEHNAQRAFEFAAGVSQQPHPSGQKIKTPAVVGAVIDLGLCLNLLDSRSIAMIRAAHEELLKGLASLNADLPKNSGGTDLFRRNLDCAVLRTLHVTREANDEPPFQTVRAAFIEGAPLYENAGFSAKTHIQICVRELRCIKGYFRPLDDDGKPIKFV